MNHGFRSEIILVQIEIHMQPYLTLLLLIFFPVWATQSNNLFVFFFIVLFNVFYD